MGLNGFDIFNWALTFHFMCNQWMEFIRDFKLFCHLFYARVCCYCLCFVKATNQRYVNRNESQVVYLMSCKQNVCILSLFSDWAIPFQKRKEKGEKSLQIISVFILPRLSCVWALGIYYSNFTHSLTLNVHGDEFMST